MILLLSLPDAVHVPVVFLGNFFHIVANSVPCFIYRDYCSFVDHLFGDGDPIVLVVVYYPSGLFDAGICVVVGRLHLLLLLSRFYIHTTWIFCVHSVIPLFRCDVCCSFGSVVRWLFWCGDGVVH